MFKLDLEFHKVSEIEEMIIAYRNGGAVKVKDIAEVKDGLDDYRETARFNGESSIGLGIVKIANTNTVNIIEKVREKIENEIIPSLPPGLKIQYSTDDSIYIKSMVKSLQEHIVEGTILASLIVLLFLGSIRSTLIIAVAIPISLLGAIAVMYFFNFTFNSMTLLALILLIGIVVDDSIVVLENVFRHHKKIDKNIFKASINGSNEVVFAVLASSISLVCIFGPVIFMEGIVGRFFESFAIVVTSGVLVSLIVSLTLTPMLCSKFLTKSEKTSSFLSKFDKLFHSLESAYKKILTWSLNHRWKVMLLSSLVVLSSAFFFSKVEKTFLPEQDESRFSVRFKTPLGSNIDYTYRKLLEIENVLSEYQDFTKGVFSSIGLGSKGQVNSGYISVMLKDKSDRELSQSEIIKEIKKDFDSLSGVKAFISAPSIAGGRRSEPLQFSLIGPNIESVSSLADKLLIELSQLDGLGRIDLDLQLNLPQMNLVIDRDRAASFGISASNIANAISVFSNGLDVARFNDDPGDGQRYDIRMKAKDGLIEDMADLKKINLRTSSGDLIRLDSIASFTETLGPAVMGRQDLQYSANFFANPSISLGEAVNSVKEVSKDILPSEYSIKLIGQAKEFAKTTSNILFAFSLATVLLYMVLSSLFNSFFQPLIVMLAQPLAIIGGVMLLWVTGNSLNIYSMIGMVLLIGLVAKNSILLVDMTNQIKSKGKKTNQALLEACPIRLRPVLMTSLTLILALLPAALGYGAGSETNGPLSVAVIGGMLSSTLLTLVVIPSAYSLSLDFLERKKIKS